MILSVGLEGCKSFTLIGSVNLGLGGEQADSNMPDGPPSDAGEDTEENEVCYAPLPQGAKEELKALGYTPSSAPNLHHWLTSQGQLRQQLPECKP